MEIEVGLLDEESRDIVKVFGFIKESKWYAARAIANAPDSILKVAMDLDKVHKRLSDIEEYLRPKVENIATNRGAEPYDFVSFTDVFTDTIASLDVRERE